MEEAQEAKLDKDKSLKITTETHFGTTKGDLRVYREDLTPIDYDSFPKVIITAAEDLEKFQKGIIRIEVEDFCRDKESYLIQVDGLLSIVYSVYANTLNDLRTPSFRQKTVRLIEKFKKK